MPEREPRGPPRRPRRNKQHHTLYLQAVAHALRQQATLALGSSPMTTKGGLHTRASLPEGDITADRAFIPLTTGPKSTGITLNVLYDSGAQASILNADDFQSLIRAQVKYAKVDSTGFALTAANNSAIHCQGLILATLHTPTTPITVPFFICPQATTSILGMNAIRKFNLILDPTNLTADVRAIGIGELKVNQDPVARLVRQTDLGPRTIASQVTAQLADAEGNEIRGERTIAVNQGITCSLVNVNERGRFQVPLANVTNNDHTFRKNEVIGQVGDIDSAVYISAMAIRDKALKAPPARPHTPQEKKKIIKILAGTINPDVPTAERRALMTLLTEYEDVFSADKNDIGLCPLRDHTIELTDNIPVFRPQYRLPAEHLAAIKSQIVAWAALGIVKRGYSPYNNPIFAVPKPHGREGLRVVLDFRGLNAKTLPDRFCIPSVDELLGVIGDSEAKYFSTLDLSSGFYHIPIAEKDQKYTAFTLPGLGQYFWTRAAMGLTGSPSSFCRAVCEILHDVEGCLSYVDDLLCFTQDIPNHITTLKTMLGRLRQGGLKVNAEKCHFLQTELEYLGANISQHGIRPTLDKTKTVREMAPPDTPKRLSLVLGFFNYMSKYIYHYSAKVAPLMQLTRKEHKWRGGALPPAALNSFNRIRQELTTRPIVGYITGDQPLHLYVDAALGGQRDIGKGFGAAVLQDTPDGVRRPVAYISRQLAKHEENYPAGLAELKATTWAILKLSHHLKHRSFYLYSDHKPLTDKMLSACHKKTFAHCSTLIEDYYPIWRHIPGKANVIADFLSRFHGMRDNEPRRKSTSTPLPPPDWNNSSEKADFNKLRGDAYSRKQLNLALVTHRAVNLLATDTSTARIRWLQQQDDTCIDILKDIGGRCAGSTPDTPFDATTTHFPNPVTVWKGVLMIKPGPKFDAAPSLQPRAYRIYAPFAMRSELLVHAHGGPIPFGGHFGEYKTLHRLSADFFWPGMQADCKKLCKECDICHMATNKNVPPPPPARSINAPHRPGVIVQMDLQGPVTSTKYGKESYILAIIDTFSKHLTLRLLPGKAAHDVVPQMLKYCLLMGVPKQILTDRGTDFNNALEKDMCNALGIQRLLTASYHPQSNGLTEEANKTIKNYIMKARSVHEKEARDFDELLLPLAFSYNTSRHSRTRVTPFEATFGYAPRNPVMEDYSDVFASRTNPELTSTDFLSRHMQALKDFRSMIVENQRNAQEETREQHDRRTGARSPNYNPRQPICIRNFYRGPVNPKFINKWTPGWIIKQVKLDTYLVYVKDAGRNKRGDTKVINARDLKPDASPTAPYLSPAKCQEVRYQIFNKATANTEQAGQSRPDNEESQAENQASHDPRDNQPDDDNEPRPGTSGRRNDDEFNDAGDPNTDSAPGTDSGFDHWQMDQESQDDDLEAHPDDLEDAALEQPQWGPRQLPNKKGLRPSCEIERSQQQRGRPKNKSKATPATKRQSQNRNIPLKDAGKKAKVSLVTKKQQDHIYNLLKTQEGRAKLLQELRAGRYAVTTQGPERPPADTSGNDEQTPEISGNTEPQPTRTNRANEVESPEARNDNQQRSPQRTRQFHNSHLYQTEHYKTRDVDRTVTQEQQQYLNDMAGFQQQLARQRAHNNWHAHQQQLARTQANTDDNATTDEPEPSPEGQEPPRNDRQHSTLAQQRRKTSKWWPPGWSTSTRRNKRRKH